MVSGGRIGLRICILLLLSIDQSVILYMMGGLEGL